MSGAHVAHWGCTDTMDEPEACCICKAPATTAVVSEDGRSHARCDKHGRGEVL